MQRLQACDPCPDGATCAGGLIVPYAYACELVEPGASRFCLMLSRSAHVQSFEAGLLGRSDVSASVSSLRYRSILWVTVPSGALERLVCARLALL